MTPANYIRDLRASGMTQKEMAASIGASQSYVSDLERGVRGKRIGFEVGQKLHTLWLEKCGHLGDGSVPPAGAENNVTTREVA